LDTGLHAFLLPVGAGRSGQRLCIHHTPADARVRGAVLYLHPFAEEMNKSRRMAALASRALARAGFAVLQIDLLGCGDSSGDFGDATWDDWIADAQLGAQWLRQRHAAPLWLWGLRAGCLLAAEAGARLDGEVGHLYWQPPASGKALLQQFLRLRLAADLLEAKADKSDDPRQQLAAGRPVEIAGYLLNPLLARGLEHSQLKPPSAATHGLWLEATTRDDTGLLPATQATLARWRDAGYAVQAEVVRGPAFWQTQEIEDAPALVDATVRGLLSQPQTVTS
jgi:uncharacterized protein